MTRALVIVLIGRTFLIVYMREKACACLIVAYLLKKKYCNNYFRNISLVK